ncbi:hypothetical protein PCANC_19411 [Puccinia coronata f. sp. avenae]|uniref:Uncharacterized protein n=1 Tax=Puccinia coronata f. sp. avenae TaxID=200324 RepID=A0A2N5TZK1_9BASI|nr:hypothetical protein PCASD_20461 [Puccinia coronata f. sp. avenae]PLW43741.1 hypothetical protein PCANC_19411 [Puccinia coronata f. sp. avenae]
MVTFLSSSLAPPFPRLGLASTTFRSLIDPPTMYLFGGLFDGELQQDVYFATYRNHLASTSLMINIFRAHGIAPLPRSHAQLTTHKCSLFVWGGQTSPTTPVDNGWLYKMSLVSHSWSLFLSASVMPRANTF